MNATLPGLWRLGALLGSVSGLVYVLTEMLMAVLTSHGLDLPFRWWASLVLGQSALNDSVHASIAVFVGLVVVGISTVLTGILFAALVGRFPGLAATPGTLIIAGASYGGGLWLWVVVIMANLAWPWFAQADSTLQFVAFVLGFGAPLGLLFVLAGVHRPSELE